ncbi:hypothetical protein [Actinokineospora bangkokensis]|uniref:TerD domain-containing protein n=1 Tax=Actinokineospora bangkokensis TaxID=1193682 RepID=A0A1Q9LNY9_9PSEU|nr:hypothetical protein [Actinokineospora bangkokensis]OLR93766.1 hypothetical protein BJP25_16090 [Actinokineospora bangkokensis]
MRNHTIITRTLRVPRVAGPAGDGAGVARRLDAALAGVGFTCSSALLEHVSGLAPHTATTLAVEVVAAVRELVGDQVAHNSYFIDFPRGVPDTVEFWVGELRKALVAPRTDATGTTVPTDADLLAAAVSGELDLLAIPTYGRYQHTYAELLAAHDELVARAGDRVTTLHLGATLDEEALALYAELAGSTTPLGEQDRLLLTQLAAEYRDHPQPTAIPVRENRALVNAVRLAAGLDLIAVDHPTDVLRLACQVSGGDVTLRTPTRFRSLPRRRRRALLGALDAAVAAHPGTLADVTRYAERWKRLAERLHPGELPELANAQRVFAVARGQERVPSTTARAEAAFARRDPVAATRVLAPAPGLLLRSVDRLLRSVPEDATGDVLAALGAALPGTSGRVLCSVREHLLNRDAPAASRLFVNRNRRAWIAPDRRAVPAPGAVAAAAALLDDELARRLPTAATVVVDPAVLAMAVPLSGAAAEDGFAVAPRGSRTPVVGEVLRFFTHWRQRARRTDWDLSALLLDDDFHYTGHVSWTRLRDEGAVYSGDITEAPDGATEFIDLPLASIGARYLVPQVSVYSGEGFDEVAESMFGWMTRDADQGGAPFEARTVRTRSQLRGTGRVSLPMVFHRADDGSWSALWTHLYLSGRVDFNQVETHKVTTTALTRSVVDRRYLTVGHLVQLIGRTAGRVSTLDTAGPLVDPVLYIGLEDPGTLPEGSTVITLSTLNQLVPA